MLCTIRDIILLFYTISYILYHNLSPQHVSRLSMVIFNLLVYYGLSSVDQHFLIYYYDVNKLEVTNKRPTPLYNYLIIYLIIMDGFSFFFLIWLLQFIYASPPVPCGLYHQLYSYSSYTRDYLQRLIIVV